MYTRRCLLDFAHIYTGFALLCLNFMRFFSVNLVADGFCGLTDRYIYAIWSLAYWNYEFDYCSVICFYFLLFTTAFAIHLKAYYNGLSSFHLIRFYFGCQHNSIQCIQYMAIKKSQNLIFHGILHLIFIVEHLKWGLIHRSR